MNSQNMPFSLFCLRFSCYFSFFISYFFLFSFSLLIAMNSRCIQRMKEFKRILGIEQKIDVERRIYNELLHNFHHHHHRNAVIFRFFSCFVSRIQNEINFIHKKKENISKEESSENRE